MHRCFQGWVVRAQDWRTENVLLTSVWNIRGFTMFCHDFDKKYRYCYLTSLSIAMPALRNVKWNWNVLTCMVRKRAAILNHKLLLISIYKHKKHSMLVYSILFEMIRKMWTLDFFPNCRIHCRLPAGKSIDEKKRRLVGWGSWSNSLQRHLKLHC